MRAAVEQILALQIDVAAGEIAAAGERRRPAGIVGEQAVELGLERGIVLRIEESGLELLERGDEDFGDVSAAEAAEAAVSGACAQLLRQRAEARRTRPRSSPATCGPGAASIAEPTSIP